MQNTIISQLRRIIIGAICLLLANSIPAQTWTCWDPYGSGFLFRVTARSGLTLRKAPLPTASKLTAIPYGEMVYNCGTDYVRQDTFDGKTDYWYKVTYNDSTGYVFGGFLEEVKHYPFQMIVPNSGIESIWEFLSFDTSYTWYGLFQSEPGTYGDFGDLGAYKYRFEKLNLKTRKGPGNSTDVYHQPVNMEDPPIAVFSGLPVTDKPVFGRWLEGKTLFPGEVLYYQMYDDQSGRWMQYALFAEGCVFKESNTKSEPVSGVVDYAVWLQVAEMANGSRDLSKPVREQCLFRGTTAQRHFSQSSPYFQVLHFIGDLDNDGQLDLILGDPARGFDYQLYLSSQANPGFLLKIVAEYIDYEC